MADEFDLDDFDDLIFNTDENNNFGTESNPIGDVEKVINFYNAYNGEVIDNFESEFAVSSSNDVETSRSKRKLVESSSSSSSSSNQANMTNQTSKSDIEPSVTGSNQTAATSQKHPVKRIKSELKKTLPKNSARVEHLLTVPHKMTIYLMEGDMSGFHDLIYESFTPDCVFICEATPGGPRVGRDKLIDFYIGISKSFPDLVTFGKNPKLHKHIVTIFQFFFGTRTTHHEKRLKQILRGHSEIFDVEKEVLSQLREASKLAQYRAQSYGHFVMNEAMTHFEKLIITIKSIDVSSDDFLAARTSTSSSSSNSNCSGSVLTSGSVIARVSESIANITGCNS